MKKITPFLMALLLLAGCGAQSEESTYRQINAEEAAVMMEEESSYIILDVRTAPEYSEKHIPGAINIPNETIGTEDIPELPDKEQLILVYCRSGNRSKQASEKLVKLGYTNIVEFGGINDWTGETVSGEA
ncbi:MAG: rhodanese-like domain-containing protein [Faecousia sp.]